ncbi:hypothetical protein SAMN04489758_101191 [Thomasclavelia cocleata]|uniref:Uncharacterized protein n=1 Tax=Thomasclavelia cocleata TaxID=69824 RepID=A0A1I0BMV0_9FIRM|nr:hypothetical protein [Thomasclavelia cocleata]MCR1960176.1 hypothetical protein [Thomasclavelia cocleata]NDO41850.1 hypothetical protein [Thomasclavelia cocleata]SET08280.1 hypothetical protein SAMN04489758_101191 [Thomasclavelia cocleata]
MELTVKELKENIFNYLESTIKNTPQNFKDLIEAIILFKEKCNTNLSVFAGLEFNAWGDFRGGVIRIGEGYANEDERILIDSDDFEHFQKYDSVKDYIFDYICKAFPFFDEDSDSYDEKSSDDLYEELHKSFKKDEKFAEYEKKYLYMRMAERMKKRFETILVGSGLTDKAEQTYPLKVYHNNRLIISFGIKYKID